MAFYRCLTCFRSSPLLSLDLYTLWLSHSLSSDRATINAASVLLSSLLGACEQCARCEHVKCAIREKHLEPAALRGPGSSGSLVEVTSITLRPVVVTLFFVASGSCLISPAVLRGQPAKLVEDMSVAPVADESEASGGEGPLLKLVIKIRSKCARVNYGGGDESAHKRRRARVARCADGV